MNENFILITRRHDKILTVLFQNNMLVQVHADSESTNNLGNIYVGKVQNILKNMESAFVEIANKQICYLSFQDATHPYLLNRNYDGRIVVGDELLVQVTKEPIKTKEATVSCHLSFAGKYMVLTTDSRKIGYSNKLSNAEQQALKTLLAPLRSKDFGIVVRTNARELLNGKEEYFEAELTALKENLSHTIETGMHRTVYSTVFKQAAPYIVHIQNFYINQYDRIVTDEKDLYENIAEYFKQQPEYLERLSFYKDEMLNLSKLYSLETKIADVMQKKVWLKSGGYLVIEHTEALTVIDVNSGKYMSKKAMEVSILKINMEAAKEIARQLRLRNISGIIIVDFINMKEEKNYQTLISSCKNYFREDPTKTAFVDMTALGLMEITRKKIKTSLYEQLMHNKPRTNET